MLSFFTSYDDRLKADGHQKVQIRSPRRSRGPVRGDLTPTIWGKGGGLVVTTRPLEVRSRVGTSPLPVAAVEHAFEQALTRLIRLLATCRGTFGSGPLRLVLCGGGTLQLPGWFLAQVAALGVQVDIMSPAGTLEVIQPASRFDPDVLRHILEGSPDQLIGRRFPGFESPPR